MASASFLLAENDASFALSLRNQRNSLVLAHLDIVFKLIGAAYDFWNNTERRPDPYRYKLSFVRISALGAA